MKEHAQKHNAWLDAPDETGYFWSCDPEGNRRIVFVDNAGQATFMVPTWSSPPAGSRFMPIPFPNRPRGPWPSGHPTGRGPAGGRT